MKNAKTIKNKKTSATRRAPATHVFRNVTDPLCADANTSPPVLLYLTTDATGTAHVNPALSPVGVKGCHVAAPYADTMVETPHLPWLKSTAPQFKEYRVLRAVAKFLPNLGSTTYGRVAFASSTNFSDTWMSNNGVTSGATVFELANTKGIHRVPLNVSTAWKNVTNRTVTMYPDIATGASSFLVTNSVDDLMFTVTDILVTGAPANMMVGTVEIEYDVEFRGPISPARNY